MEPIPFLDLRAQYRTIAADIERALQSVLDDQQFILGPHVDRFEAEVAAHLGIRHAVGCASGSDALLLALLALGIGPGDGVVVPAYSFFATAGQVVRAGALPLFADVADPDLNMGPGDLDRARARAPQGIRVRAVVPVHLFGRTCDMEGILDAAQEQGLAVIEDAAQAFGARHRLRAAGTLGDAGCFSFFPSKNLGGCGDGGMLVTNRDEVAAMARALRAHGQVEPGYHAYVGWNSRLDALQAALLSAKLPYLEGWNEARRAHAQAYDEALSGTSIRVPPRDGGGPDRLHVRFDIYHQYVIRHARRDALRRGLEKRGVGTAVYYPRPLHLQPCFQSLGYSPGAFPVADQASREVLALPIYPEMTVAQRARVIEAVLESVAEASV